MDEESTKLRFSIFVRGPPDSKAGCNSAVLAGRSVATFWAIHVQYVHACRRLTSHNRILANGGCWVFLGLRNLAGSQNGRFEQKPSLVQYHQWKQTNATGTNNAEETSKHNNSTQQLLYDDLPSVIKFDQRR